MNHAQGCPEPDVIYHNQIWTRLKIAGYCQNCGATDIRRPWGALSLDQQFRFRSTTPSNGRNRKMFEIDSILERHGLPPEAARFLPDGPDIEGRARDLAEILRQIRTTHTINNIGRN